jgi:hypothetical protein
MMTPKEKAEELVQKYLNTIIHFPYIDTEDGNCIGTGYMTHNSAVRCSIKAVDEILNNNCGANTDGQQAYEEEIYCDEYFWNDVKSELQNI